MNDSNIGFIGLGNVGSKLANSILIGGYNLFIHDLNKNLGKKLIKRGATWSNNINEISKNCTIIIDLLVIIIKPKTLKY